MQVFLPDIGTVENKKLRSMNEILRSFSIFSLLAALRECYL